MESKAKKTKASTDEAINTTMNEKVTALANALESIQDDLASALRTFRDNTSEATISDSERRRLLGSGVRRYGFIDKVSDIAQANSDFVPPFLNLAALKELIRQIETLRNISTTLQQLVRLNGDLLLTTGDTAFRMALLYYNTVRDASRGRVPGAQAVFRDLQLFFQRPRRGSAEPTEAELERDVKALLHGKKDGKIVVENEKPHMVGGKHVVVDEVHNDRVSFRESEE